MAQQVGGKRMQPRLEKALAIPLFRKIKLGHVLLALPPLLVLIFILGFGRNTPFWDEWELVPLFRHLHTGHFYWHDFWQQHNEHRILLPTLVFVGLAYLTHWNTQVECLLSLLLAIWSFWLANKVLGLTLGGKLKFPFIGLLLVALIWFSPVQVENWLWGWQLAWFMNVLGCLVVILVLARAARDRHLSLSSVGLLLIGGVLAQYSLGNGTILWPLAVLALLYLRVAWSKVISVAVVGTLTTILYYINYTNPSRVSQRLAVYHPLLAAQYFFVYLGRPLSFVHVLIAPLGILVLLTFITLVLTIFMRDRNRFKAMVPWMVLGFYAIGTAFVTTLARLNLGIGEAFSSRYTTISSLLLVSVVVLGFVARGSVWPGLKEFYQPIMRVVCSGIFVLVLANWAWGVHSGVGVHRTRVALAKCTQQVDPTQLCLLSTYPNATTVQQRLAYIKQIHWAGY